MRVSSKVTLERVQEAVERQMRTLDNPGFCIDCGAEAEGCEPDAAGYLCDECGKNCVFGAEYLLMSAMLRAPTRGQGR